MSISFSNFQGPCGPEYRRYSQDRRHETFLLFFLQVTTPEIQPWDSLKTSMLLKFLSDEMCRLRSLSRYFFSNPMACANTAWTGQSSFGIFWRDYIQAKCSGTKETLAVLALGFFLLRSDSQIVPQEPVPSFSSHLPGSTIVLREIASELSRTWTSTRPWFAAVNHSCFAAVARVCDSGWFALISPWISLFRRWIRFYTSSTYT